MSILNGNRNKQMVGTATTLDLVFVIDGTGSMQNLLDAVKDNALNLHPRIMQALREKRRAVTKMRIKVIIFRDVYVDTEAFVQSDFFTLPDEAENFRAFVEAVRATGGGDEPESGLEALHLAMNSDWNRDPNAIKRRQIIIMMTDASAHALDDPQRAVDPVYPKGMPENLNKLNEEWLNNSVIDEHGKRLAIFAPNMYPWSEIGSIWDHVQPTACVPGKGMTEAVLQPVIDYIAGSI